MPDIYIDPISEDISIESNKIRLTESNLEEVRQKVQIRLKTFREEWFMNADAGLPYFQQILNKGVTKNFIDAQIKSATIRTDGVINIVNFSSELDTRLRTYTATLTVSTSEGIVVIEFSQ